MYSNQVEILKLYLENILTIVENDETIIDREIKNFADCAKLDLNERNDWSLDIIEYFRALINLTIASKLYTYCLDYLKNKEIDTNLTMFPMEETLLYLREHQDEFLVEFPVFTTNELYHAFEYIDDKGKRRILSNCNLSSFDTLYYSILNKDYNSFSSSIADEDPQLISFEWILEYVKTKHFEKYLYDCLSDPANQDLFFDFQYACFPNILPINQIIQQSENNESPYIDAFINLYPNAIREYQNTILTLISHSKLSYTSRTKLGILYKTYEFIFEQQESTIIPNNPETIPACAAIFVLVIKKIMSLISVSYSNQNESISDPITNAFEEEINNNCHTTSKRFRFPNVINIQEPGKKNTFLEDLYIELYENLLTPVNKNISKAQFMYLFGAYNADKPKDYPKFFIWLGKKYQFALLLRLLFDPEEQKTAQNGFIVLFSDYDNKKSTKWTSGTNIQLSNREDHPTENLRIYASKIIELVRKHGGKYKGELRWAKEL